MSVDLKAKSEFEEKHSTDDALLSIPAILKAKRENHQLTQNEIKFLVNAICDGRLEDAQLGAFLMAVCLRGMTKSETTDLTSAMMHSGTVFEWPKSWKVVDKHSTGGVGDKVSLALAPALAALGLKVPMISGRGLGHTGGTLDKLESIPGFRVCLSEDEMRSVLASVGCCIVGQTAQVVPADKRMYAARDVTSTVDNIPLIVSSIISKKAVESLDSLVLDVKFGIGSFMKSQLEAEKLAEALTEASLGVGVATCALVTRMDTPIGRAVGNALEVEEAVQCMRGKGPKDLLELVVALGGELVASSGVAASVAEGEAKIKEVLNNGSARRVFAKMIEAQGVSPEVSEMLCAEQKDENCCLPKAKYKTPIQATKSGKISSVDAMSVAEVCLSIGAGRRCTSDRVNYAVGMTLHKIVGDFVQCGDSWASIHHDAPLSPSCVDKASSAIHIEEGEAKLQGSLPPQGSLIVRRISKMI